MTVEKILDSVQYVVDGTGNRKAVQLELSVWEELITLLEDLEDVEELARLREAVQNRAEEVIFWKQAKAST